MSSKIKFIRYYALPAANPESLEGSLQRQGYNRVPGTVIKVFPRSERGVIKTGLDENAIKFQSYPQDVREMQRASVKELREKLEAELGESLTPDAPFWENVTASGYSLTEGDNIFDLSEPLSAVNYYWLMETGAVALSKADLENGKHDPTQVNFYLHDPEESREKEFTRKKRLNTLIVSLDTMSEGTMRKVAKLLGVGLLESANIQDVYNNLDEYLRRPASDLDIDPLQEFERVTAYSSQLLHVKYIIRKLLERNIVRVKGGVVLEGENVWAPSLEKFEQDLLDIENQAILINFEEKIKNKEIINATL